jgi:fused-like protein
LVELGDYVYDLKAMIGKGAFGSVYECKHKTRSDLSLCIKIIEQGLEDPKILREMNLMKDLITSS